MFRFRFRLLGVGTVSAVMLRDDDLAQAVDDAAPAPLGLALPVDRAFLCHLIPDVHVAPVHEVKVTGLGRTLVRQA